MRDRLIELIRQGKKAFTKSDTTYIENYLADYLLANGVALPACRIGQTVYALYDRSEKKNIDGHIKKRNSQIDTLRYLGACKMYGKIEVREKQCTKADLNKIGKTVFLTKTEAEKASAGKRYVK